MTPIQVSKVTNEEDFEKINKLKEKEFDKINSKRTYLEDNSTCILNPNFY